MKYLKQVGFVVLFVAVLAMPTSAADLAVGSEGKILQLSSGLYGDLFPGGVEADPQASVLAIDFLGSNETVRSLVPSTADLGPEFSPTLYHDPTIDVTYVLWSSRHNGIHPYLRLAQWSDGVWSDTIDITGSVFASKNDPQLSVHHESWTDAEGQHVERTVFHVLWWEELGATIEKRAAGVVVKNGTLVGSTSILTLSNFVQETEAEAARNLSTSIRLVESNGGMIVGFVDAADNVQVLSSEVLPAALSQLAMAVEQAILGFDPAAGLSLQSTVVDTILESGQGFHPATLTAMADAVLDEIEAAGSPENWLEAALGDLAGKAMPHIIHIGASMKSGGLANHAVSVVAARPEPTANQLHHLAFSNLATFPIPTDTPLESTELYISRRGTAALVAWDEGDYVAYRETTVDGWTDVSFLDVTKGIDRDTAYRILEERTLER